MNICISGENGHEALEKLISQLNVLMRITIAKRTSKELGFICLFTDGNGTYWFKVSRGFSTAQNETLSSLEKLIDDTKDSDLGPSEKEKINMIYRMINSLY